MSLLIQCDRCRCKVFTTAPAARDFFTLSEPTDDGIHEYHYCSTDCLAADWRPVT